MPPKLLGNVRINQNLTKQELGEALIGVIVDLQEDHAYINNKEGISNVVYARPLKQIIGELFELDKEHGIKFKQETKNDRD